VAGKGQDVFASPDAWPDAAQHDFVSHAVFGANEWACYFAAGKTTPETMPTDDSKSGFVVR
jgi:hypothetical protein